MAKFGTYGFAPVLWAHDAPEGQYPTRSIIRKSGLVDWDAHWWRTGTMQMWTSQKVD
jgi:hypothetical protein